MGIFEEITEVVLQYINIWLFINVLQSHGVPRKTK